MIGRQGNDPNAATLTREDLADVRKALSVALDEVLAFIKPEHSNHITVFVTDLVMKYKLTYLLTPVVIRELLESCFSKEPNRSAIEEMAARFYLNLPSADQLWKRLVQTLCAACSFHGSVSAKSLLPDDLRDNTVTFEQAEKVLNDENWLVFIATLIAFHDNEPIKEVKAKLRGING